jgi:spore coat protein U-like protein
MKKSFLILFSFLMINTVFADCFDLSVPTISYGVGDTNPSVPYNVTITRKSGNSSCANYFLAFTWGWANNYNRRGFNLYNGNIIYYNLYKNANSTNVLRGPNDLTSSNDVLFGTLAQGESKTLTYYFKLANIDAGSPPKSGTYFDNVQVQSYYGTWNNIGGFDGYRDLYVYINVSKFVSLALVDTGGTYDSSKTSRTLDFGELTESEEMSFDVRIQSNAGYILKISSANNGILKRTSGTGVKSEIGYDFYASSSKKTLSSSASNPVTIASATGATAAGGAQVPIRVVIKSVLDKDPGTYQDYLTLSVISND